MKKLFINSLIALFITTINYAQVAINTDSSEPNTSAMLDVKSTDKGFLPPRMTSMQRDAISSPAAGLFIFNTTDKTLEFYDGSAWAQLSYVNPSNAGYTIGIGGICSNTIVNGTYESSIALSGSNTINMDVVVTSTGDWSISSDLINGYSYSGSGTFASTGTLQITLDGSGTPALSQTDYFTLTSDNGGGSCTFSVTVVPNIPNVTNPTTGKIWMDRNLGASQVATSSSDAAAYGDLYQWGRLTDGHENRNSGTSTTLSSSDVPGHNNFITNSVSPRDWRNPQNGNLWQGASGINNPCPAGYRIPTSAEWDAERLSWSSNNAAGAFGSPLKLTTGGIRFATNATVNNAGSSGYYWASNAWGMYMQSISFTSAGAGGSTSSSRATGMSVRCIKE